jgi:hypothetical protein
MVIIHPPAIHHPTAAHLLMAVPRLMAALHLMAAHRHMVAVPHQTHRMVEADIIIPRLCLLPHRPRRPLLCRSRRPL